MYVLSKGSAGGAPGGSKGSSWRKLNVGDFFGELALVDSGPRSADVEALTTCTMLRIEHRGVAGASPGSIRVRRSSC